MFLGKPVYAGRFTGEFYDFAECICVHAGLEEPGQDLAAKIIKHRDLVVPSPVLDQ